DLDDGRARPEAELRRNADDQPVKLGRRRLAGGAAFIAEQEERRLVAVVATITGDEGVARFDPVDEAVLDEEIQRPVDRDRRRAPAGPAEPVDDVIGGGRDVALEQSRQNLTPLVGESEAAAGADRLGVAERLGRAA